MTAAIESNSTLAFYPFSPGSQAGRAIQANASLRLAAVSEVNKDITLHTKEGDEVTLSMDRETVAVYGRDGRLSIEQVTARTEDGAFAFERVSGETREWFGYESSQAITLTVKGDLSRDEIRDIRKALQRINRLIGRTFDQGENRGKADRFSTSLAGLDTLSGFGIDVQQSQTFMASRSTSASALIYGADARQAVSPVENMPEPSIIPWEEAADEVIGMVSESGVDREHFADPLQNLFGAWKARAEHRHAAYRQFLKMMATAVMSRLTVSDERDDD